MKLSDGKDYEENIQNVYRKKKWMRVLSVFTTRRYAKIANFRQKMKF